MKALSEQDVIRVMREEWDAKVAQLTEQVDLVMHSKQTGSDALIAPELKVRHKKSGIRYTVSSVGTQDIILRTPEGDDFLVDKETLEDAYELD